MITRRQFLKTSGFVGLSLMLPPFFGGQNATSAILDDINYVLRDFRANSIQPINKQLLDFLHAIQTRLETRQYFHVVSGYRSPATNEFLRKNNNGVAKNSMHLYGKAVDFRVPKSDLALVRKAAMDQGYGGVGYYPHSDFVHIDVGRVRRW